MIALGFVLLLPALVSAVALPADATTTTLATAPTQGHTVSNTTLTLDEDDDVYLEDDFPEDDPDFDFGQDITFEDAEDDESLEFGNSTSTLESRAGGYKLSERIVGSNFYTKFNWNSGADPTHGRTNYVNLATARKNKIVGASKTSFVMRADYKSKLNPAGAGRMSSRMESKKTYREHLSIINIKHMPNGKSTWPAFWMTALPWPNKGELDIIEGANGQGPNLSSLHTGAGCRMSYQPSKMKGKPRTDDCNAAANGNVGCGVAGDSTRDFGSSFNRNGGGWWATERTSKSIKVWFWSRKDKGIPKDITSGSKTPNPSKWGRPTAMFLSGSGCDLSKSFAENQFIINLTFCGDWAGATYPGGMAACIDHVNNNPSAFRAAYWEIRSLSIFKK